MTDEEFLEACEMAGLEFIPGDESVGTPNYWHDPRTLDAPMHGGTFGWEETDPALPAYVASLLLAKVRDMEPGPGLMNKAQRKLHHAYVNQFVGLPPEQRILAALAVLKEGE